MSDEPKNHGYIQAAKRQKLTPVKIPRRFQGKIFTSYSDIEKTEGHNGVLECKALRDVAVRGQVVKAGEVFKTAANDVVSMALQRDVEIIDSKMEQEEKVMAEAQRLGLDKPAPLDPLDFPPPPERRERTERRPEKYNIINT